MFDIIISKGKMGHLYLWRSYILLQKLRIRDIKSLNDIGGQKDKNLWGQDCPLQIWVLEATYL